jgi:Transposase IS4
LRAATTEELYQLPQDLSIDEQLIKFKGRSKHTIQMNSKAAGEGYKIYSLCCSNGYMVDFKFSSTIERVAELEHYEGFTSSESIVLDLASTLVERFPRPRPFYILHLDNFFTTRKLYQELYEREIGANGTAKAGAGIPKELAYLRDAMTKEKDHGEWFNYVVGSVNCIAFCDSASKAMMTTVHDPTVEEYAYFDAVKRPGASLKYSIPSPATQAAESAKSTPFRQAVESTNTEATKTGHN